MQSCLLKETQARGADLRCLQLVLTFPEFSLQCEVKPPGPESMPSEHHPTGWPSMHRRPHCAAAVADPPWLGHHDGLAAPFCMDIPVVCI
jgi:hypothetical protein